MLAKTAKICYYNTKHDTNQAQACLVMCLYRLGAGELFSPSTTSYINYDNWRKEFTSF